jgi:hypothetical protein
MTKLETKAKPGFQSTPGGEMKQTPHPGHGGRGQDNEGRGWANSRRGNNRNNNRRVAIPATTFTGEVKALHGCYLDSSNSYRANNYKKYFKILSAYAARQYTYSTDVRHVITKLAKPGLPMPRYPFDSDTARVIWKEEVSRYVKRKGKLNENIGSLYSLVMGQCTDAMKAKLSSCCPEDFLSDGCSKSQI